MSFRFFQMSYNWKYYFERPKLWPKLFTGVSGDVYRGFKWAWQRVYRGWDDRVIWSIDHHLCDMMPIWLGKLKQVKNGYPIEFTKYGDSKIAEAKWNEQIDIMIAGFVAAKRLLDSDLPILSELDSELKHITPLANDDIEEWQIAREEIVKRINFRERIEIEEKALRTEYQRGMSALTHWFFNLWD